MEVKQQKKILLIEDDSFISELLAMRFKKYGFSFDHAENAEIGLAKVKIEKPALILVDVVMPGMGGFAFLKLIKADKETASIPVIILTNLGQKIEIEEGMSLGAKDYLIKATHSLDEIMQKINQTLDEEVKD